jgi:hypothetical protein
VTDTFLYLVERQNSLLGRAKDQLLVKTPLNYMKGHSLVYLLGQISFETNFNNKERQQRGRETHISIKQGKLSSELKNLDNSTARKRVQLPERPRPGSAI